VVDVKQGTLLKVLKRIWRFTGVGIVKAITKKPKTIIGIDCSTKSLGFSRWESGEFKACGEIFFEGSNVWKRLTYIHHALPGLVSSGVLDGEAVLFEQAVSVGNNIETAISLAYVYGAVIGALGENGIAVAKVYPITWQAYIGNPLLNKTEREAIKADNPGMSKSWYLTKGREIRKQRTMNWARQFAEISSGSDNVSDAIGIGYYGVKHAHDLNFE
jgi:Holliday junction resolvasome RuvABC endonuclease subunit